MWGRKKKGDPEGAFTALADHGVGGSGDVSPPVQPSALSMLPPVDHARSPPLKELVRRRLHTDMLSSFKNEPAGVVLCVDNFTLRLVSSLYKVSQLAEENFYLVENITMKSERGEYLGGVITPGIHISMEALFERASKLHRVEIARPKSVIGRTTTGALQSGLLYGYSGLVDSMIGRIREELGADARVVATGGLARRIAEESKAIEQVVPFLTLDGLRILFEKNRPEG